MSSPSHRRFQSFETQSHAVGTWRRMSRTLRMRQLWRTMRYSKHHFSQNKMNYKMFFGVIDGTCLFGSSNHTGTKRHFVEFPESTPKRKLGPQKKLDVAFGAAGQPPCHHCLHKPCPTQTRLYRFILKLQVTSAQARAEQRTPHSKYR